MRIKRGLIVRQNPINLERKEALRATRSVKLTKELESNNKKVLLSQGPEKVCCGTVQFYNFNLRIKMLLISLAGSVADYQLLWAKYLSPRDFSIDMDTRPNLTQK